MAKAAARAQAAEKADPAARAVLFPRGVDVELQSGDTVTLRPWSIETTEIILQRIPELLEAMAKSEASPDFAGLAGRFLKELQTLVELSAEWETGEARARCTLIDLFALVEAIWDLNVKPLQAKVRGLGDRIAELIGQPLKMSLLSSAPSTS